MNKMLICISFIYLMISCNDGNRYEKDVRELLGREVFFPEGYEVFCRESSHVDSLLNKRIKIVTYFDYLQCTSCGVRMLNIFSEEIGKISDNATYIGVIYGKDKKAIHKMLDTLNISIPLIYYQSDIFGEKNHLTDKLSTCKTFLLNQDNQIVLVGEPFNSPQLTALYKKHIYRLRQSKK